MPTNVTDQYDPNSIPLPPINSFLASKDVMAGAEDTSYLGRFTEAEAKSLVTRTITLTKWTDMIIDHIANDSRFGYESKAEFMRHGIEMLLEYYRDNKTLLQKHGGFANDILMRQNEMRLDAERARLRTEFRNDVSSFDDELAVACGNGDWEYVARRLIKYHDMLENCESEAQRNLLRGILAGSVATRTAVTAFYRWAHSSYRAPVDKWEDSWKDVASEWSQWYQDQQAVA